MSLNFHGLQKTLRRQRTPWRSINLNILKYSGYTLTNTLWSSPTARERRRTQSNVSHNQIHYRYANDIGTAYSPTLNKIKQDNRQ